MNGCRVKTGSKKRLDRKYIVPNDSDFYTVPSDFEQNYHVVHHDDMVRGMYMQDTQRGRVYLKQHGELKDILNTDMHESLHHCFMLVQVGELGCDPVDMDVYQEHWAIQQVVWMLQDVMSDEFIDQHNDVKTNREGYYD